MTPEEMQAEIVRLQEENKNLAETNTTLKEGSTTNEKRITDLQEHNQKLFLKITTPEKKEEPLAPKKTPEELANEIKI